MHGPLSTAEHVFLLVSHMSLTPWCSAHNNPYISMSMKPKPHRRHGRILPNSRQERCRSHGYTRANGSVRNYRAQPPEAVVVLQEQTTSELTHDRFPPHTTLSPPLSNYTHYDGPFRRLIHLAPLERGEG